MAGFEQACQALVARHEILRTSFSWAGLEEPLQQVHTDVVAPFAREDLRALEGSEQQARLDAHLREDRRRGFDVGAAPLTRFAVFRLAAAD